MTRTRSGVSSNPFSPPLGVPPRRDEGAIEPEDFFDAPVDEQDSEGAPAAGKLPAGSAAVSVGAARSVGAATAEGTGGDNGVASGGEAATAEGASGDDSEARVAAAAAAEGARGEHCDAPAVVAGSAGGVDAVKGIESTAGELDADEQVGDGAGGRGSRGMRRLDAFRINKVDNAPNSRFVVDAVDIKSLNPGFVVAPPCVDLWMETYLPELPCCLSALEVRAGAVFKELGTRDSARWFREPEVEVLTMSGEKWLPAQYSYSIIPVYIDG